MMTLSIRLSTVFAYIMGFVAITSQRVYAGGMEYTGAGTESLARGGAVTARADSPMVLDNNPAGLAELRGTQLLFDLNMALFSACVDPIGYYGWGTYNPQVGGAPSRFTNPKTGQQETIYLGITPERVASGQLTQADYDRAMTYYNDPLDTVCLKQSYLPIPQLVFAKRVSEHLGIGAGLIFPAQQPSGSWGGEDGVIIGKTGDVRPSPVRYVQLEARNLGVFPTIGLGYRLPGLERIRLGLALQWGMVFVTNRVMTGNTGGTTPRGDVPYEIHAKDLFVPGVTVSTHFVPIDALDFALAAKWQDDIKASGYANTTPGAFDPMSIPVTSKVQVAELRVNRPWKLRAGIRFADRIVPRPAGTGGNEGDAKNPIHDPLNDERWDIELDAEYQLNSRLRRQEVRYPSIQKVRTQAAANPVTGVVPPPTFVDFPAKIIADGVAVPAPNFVEKHWKDQVSIRLGGTYNILRGLMGVSAGVHWENRGIDPDYMQVDFWPVARLGLHGGVIVRIHRSIDLSLSYAHIFQEDIVVQPPAHLSANQIYTNKLDPNTANVVNIDKSVGVSGSGPGRVVVEETPVKNPDGTARLEQQVLLGAAGMPKYIINSGRYRSYYNVIAVGVNVHF